jgi:hypothetical protein
MPHAMSRPGPSIDAGARSPFAGCAILITAVLVMVFLIGFSILTLFRQYDEIVKFTADTPLAPEVTPLENEEAALNNLAERVESFRQQITGNSAATLALTPAEMNLAIAAYAPFKDLRGAFRVLDAENDMLRIAISFPLNGKPRRTRHGESGWITSDPRHLNGTLVTRPALSQGEVILRIESIEVPGATVPRGFIDQMSPYRIAERYLQHPGIGPAMAALTGVAIADGRLVFSRTPGETPAGNITDAEVDRAGGRFFTILALAACLFLIFAGAVVFIGLRSRSSRG